MSHKLMWIFLVLCSISIVFCYLFCVAYKDFYNHYYDTMLLSGVKTPVRLFLEEIQTDLDKGNLEESREKVAFLYQEWTKFYNAKGLDYDIGNLLVRWNKQLNRDEQEEPNDSQNE